MRNDAIASIAVDLVFGNDAADAPLTWLTIIKVDLLEPDEGMAVGREAVLLDDMQERIEEVADHLGKGRFQFRYVGRVTGDGSRQLYFYSNAAFPRTVYERVFSDPRFEPYEIARLEQEDPERAVYGQELHPGSALYALVLGDEQIKVRREAGDDLTVEREVEHALWFRTAPERQAFIDDIEKADETARVTVDNASATDSPDVRFGVTVTSTHSVNKLWTNIFVVALSTRAAQFGGTYDGWSAPVIDSRQPRR